MHVFHSAKKACLLSVFGGFEIFTCGWTFIPLGVFFKQWCNGICCFAICKICQKSTVCWQAKFLWMKTWLITSCARLELFVSCPTWFSKLFSVFSVIHLRNRNLLKKLVSWRLQLFCEQDLLWKRTWSQHLTAEREENYWNVDGRKKLHSVGKTDKKREEKWIQLEDPPVVFVEKAGGSSRRICEKSGRILPSYLWKKREDPPVVFVEKAGGILPSVDGRNSHV